MIPAPDSPLFLTNWLFKFVLKGEFQRANITRTKLLGVLRGKLLIN
jgi:hypothetical protein